MPRALLAFALLTAACSGGTGTSRIVNPTAATTALRPPTTLVAPADSVGGVSVADYYQGSCAPCHGPDRLGLSGPPLVPESLIEQDTFYFDTIRDGRPELGMPSWGTIGLADDEISALVALLRADPAPARSPSIAAVIDVGPVEAGASAPFSWELSNPFSEEMTVLRFRSPSLSAFILTPLPAAIPARGSIVLDGVFVPSDAAAPGDPVSGSAIVDLATPLGRGTRGVAILGSAFDSGRRLHLKSVSVPSQPARLAAWEDLVFVGYFNGLIDVFRFESLDGLERVETIDIIASTPNHGPDGTPQPEQWGRLIGGLAVGGDGTLYVTHSDPRLNEGEFVQTGHLADLNSGMVTALSGPAGSYGDSEGRVDLIAGLPRNVTNHVPLGMVVDDGVLYVAVGGMTDSGVPDPSKPDPDTELSGAVLSLDLTAGESIYPIVLTDPGPERAGLDALIPGVLEVFATGVRNGFGLTVMEGRLLLTDQGSDGGGVPSPADGIGGFGPNFRSDHLHEVAEGAYLGQPNLARGERVLDDGSMFDPPVASPGYSPPLYLFGIHNSATGIAPYSGDLFPELEGALLVGKFSGSEGVQALHFEGDDVMGVEVLAGEDVGNVTDVAVGPAGQIVIADFWDLQLLIATGWED